MSIEIIIGILIGLAYFGLFAYVIWTDPNKGMTEEEEEYLRDSMNRYDAPKNTPHIRPGAKPHYHGKLIIGYVHENTYAVGVFDHKGQIKGTCNDTYSARDYLRGIHKVTMEFNQ